MDYEPFLYSASARKDYRWMLVCEDFQLEDRSRLERIFAIFERYREHPALSGAVLPPTYLVDFDKGIGLFRMLRTTHRDEFGRRIFALEGIRVVGWENLLDLRCRIGQLLLEAHLVLDVSSAIDSKLADDLTLSRMGRRSYESGISLGSLRANAPGADTYPVLRIADPQRIPFTREGYLQIVAVASSPFATIPRFAFGALPGTGGIFPGLNYLAPVSS